VTLIKLIKLYGNYIAYWAARLTWCQIIVS